MFFPAHPGHPLPLVRWGLRLRRRCLFIPFLGPFLIFQLEAVDELGHLGRLGDGLYNLGQQGKGEMERQTLGSDTPYTNYESCIQ